MNRQSVCVESLTTTFISLTDALHGDPAKSEDSISINSVVFNLNSFNNGFYYMNIIRQKNMWNSVKKK